MTYEELVMIDTWRNMSMVKHGGSWTSLRQSVRLHHHLTKDAPIATMRAQKNLHACPISKNAFVVDFLRVSIIFSSHLEAVTRTGPLPLVINLVVSINTKGRARTEMEEDIIIFPLFPIYI